MRKNIKVSNKEGRRDHQNHVFLFACLEIIIDREFGEAMIEEMNRKKAI